MTIELWVMFNREGERVGVPIPRPDAERALRNRWCASIAPLPDQQLTLFDHHGDPL